MVYGSIAWGVQHEEKGLTVKMLWCWRCQMDMPMLDEAEWAELAALQASRGHGGAWLQPMLEAYERITGFHETVPAAVMHHRISQYGPPCHACGKPLRTPKAQMCAACGVPRA